ncbi:hypothetical protein [Tuwongella immobilis]|uniref:Uncharacterized protein n=1 Tax=Tuwongella immobilis TaxID=692036 RepID=A0A6C2YMZ7_9BACT|nr:hypothetical protein [Tuwongella immobilis]VIP02754.1 Uncharacterized protein OS=Isosphaera pallida (strain ATCC 43644 / DSM 9630 / IS1B) GN=Isop_1797 PE=4 SV=1 [Tuwongella immobilis]VTS02351.1 Uncharacterized protein OS=Isosphaera pallida (strain ATCC 43644 / DSM 9630 / IS1B) GN=Isop_1797 PE=4 SV=1 [Tuwongella immobilis]
MRNRLTCARCGALLPILLLLASAGLAHGQSRYALQEVFRPNDQYRVESRVRLNGRLSVPIDPNQPAKLVDMTGESKISYDERLLSPDPKTNGERSVRIYRQMEFTRKVADRPQSLNLRDAVRRVVLIRRDQTEVSFSPDGPLTWGEMDLIRTDVFTPALVGIAPPRPMAVGESWQVRETAIRELTDLETIEQGSVEATLVEITQWNQRSIARLSIKGTVKGVSEDGPTRHQIEGTLYFDLQSNHLAYLSIVGAQELLDEKGMVAGRIEGRFTLTRTLSNQLSGLDDASVQRISLEPNAENTKMLVDQSDMGFRLTHPRHWRIGTQRNQQITLDDPAGNGMLITIEPLARTPGALQYQVESKQQLAKFQAKILNETRPIRLDSANSIGETFRIDSEMSGQSVTMVYFVLRGSVVGMTIAARVQSKEPAAIVAEIEQIARSVTLMTPTAR